MGRPFFYSTCRKVLGTFLQVPRPFLHFKDLRFILAFFPMKVLKCISLSLYALSLVAYAEKDYELPREIASVVNEEGPELKLYSNVNLNITRIANVSDIGFGLTAGTDLVWHFSPAVGAFIGADYSQIKGEEKGEKISVDYIDIPVGVAF